MAPFFEFRSLRAAARLKTIVAILAKHGFDEVVRKLGLPCRKAACPLPGAAHMTVWAKIVMVIEELGPTTIKIGQAVSARPDLIPPELARELTHLQEDVKPEPFAAVKKAVEESLGQPLSELFSEFSETSSAAASLSQVHRARLKTGPDAGKEVAVKVRRPGIVPMMLADLDLAGYLADLAHQRSPALRAANLPDMVQEVRKTVLREVDFLNEAQNIQLFRTYFKDDPTVVAPRVFADLCREDVLVMEWIEGVRVDRFQGSPERRARLARIGLDACVKMMLTHGFFHADPHFGNIRILPRNPASGAGEPEGVDRLCFYDWGMVGRLTPDMRSAIIDYLIGIVQQDPKRVARVALDMAVKVPPLIDFQRFQTDVMFVLERVFAPLESSANMGRFLIDLTAVCRNHDIHLRSDYVLMARALIAIEAAGRTISPGFDVMAAFTPLAREYAIKRSSIFFSDRPLFSDLEDTLRAMAALPRTLSRVASLAEAGELSSEIRVRGMEELQHSLNRAGNRVSSALVTSGLVIGSSLVFLSDIGPHWYGLPTFGLIGFTISGVFALGLALHMYFKDR